MAMEAPGAGGGFAPLGIGDIITKSFEVFKKDFAKMVGIAAIIIVPVTVVLYLLIDLLTPDPQSINTVEDAINALESYSTTKLILAGSLATIAGGLLVFGLSFLLQAALMRGAALSLVGDPTADEAYKFGMKRLGSYFMVAIQVALIAGVAPFLVAIVLTFVITSAWGLWMLAAFAASIYLSFRFSMAIPALVIENKRGSAALDRSWEIVKDHMWHVIGAIVVSSLLVLIVGGIIGAVFGAFGAVWIQGIGQAIGYLLTMPFAVIVYVVLYTELRARSGGYTTEQFKADLAAGA